MAVFSIYPAGWAIAGRKNAGSHPSGRETPQERPWQTQQNMACVLLRPVPAQAEKTA